MWKAIQEQIQSVPSHTSEEESSVDLKLNDLVQENSILRQELADLYEHLTIIDDTSDDSGKEVPSNSRMSSLGRLIVYNKSKHDTEMLMKQEDLRQKSILLEKELSYQTSHMKEQVTKIKELEGKLKMAQAKLLTSDAETVAATSLRQKVQEMKGQLSAQAQELHTAMQRNAELITQHDRDAVSVDMMRKAMAKADREVTVLSEQLVDRSEQLKGANELSARLSMELSEATMKEEQQEVLLMKYEVDLMTSQTESKHLERKVEAQSKELLKLYESVSSLRATVTQKELELTKEREKVCERCVNVTVEEVESCESNASLMRGGVVTNRDNGRENRTCGAMTKEISAKGGRTINGTGGVNQRDYKKVSSENSSEHGQKQSEGRKQRREKESSTIGEYPLLFGDPYSNSSNEEEDCLCAFFPNTVGVPK